jgi:phosphoribosylanthranilate isomerase
MPTSVKICGLTDAKTARAALDLGADYLGVVLTDSPRQVSLEFAEDLARDLPDARLVAVAKDPPETLFSAMLELTVWGVQIHGSAPQRWIERAQQAGKRAIAARVDPRADIVLMDNANPGSGVARDWIVPEVDKPVWLAGGISPANVADVVRRLRPAGVDVSSGVERQGVKSAELIQHFIEEVHHAENQRS